MIYASGGVAAGFLLMIGVICLLAAPFQPIEPVDFKSVHKESSWYHLCLFLFFEFFFLWSSIKIAGAFHGLHENPYISISIVAMGFILDFWLCWFYYKKVD